MTGDTQFDEYLQNFDGWVRERRLGEVDGNDSVVPVSPREMAITKVFLTALEEIGHLPDLEIAYLDKRMGRSNAKVNAYGVSEGEARVDLVVTISDGENDTELQNVPAGRIGTEVKKALQVFRAASEPVHNTMEPASPACDMMERLHSVRDGIDGLRVVVLIAGLAKRLPDFEQPDDLPEVQLDIWDLERLFRADTSGLTYESVTIDIVEHLGRALPCLPAANTEEDHRCYLSIIPGDLLHDLYHKYGPRLLELNVRSFLQARGKVNRGIRDTLNDDPGHFLPYNNGISVTAEEVVLVQEPDGSSAISSIMGLQVVNGGQTVASIHRARNRDGVDLSRVHVQAKITVVKPDCLDTLVPFISRYSNTQNKVNETDFSANHPFHVKIQKLSEQIWVPGETSRWFYERARGQWEVARAREGTTPARLRAFDLKAPRSQKIDKTLLSKALNAWSELPDVVSMGGQKNFVRFMDGLATHANGWEPDEKYYRDTVAKVIILKRAEKVARQIAFTAYRANAVSHTVSLLAYRTAGRVNLAEIWNNQNVSAALEETMRSWMPLVHEEIVESAEGRNVTEWCKKRECWTRVQSLHLDFAPGFEDELADGLPLPTVGQFNKKGGGAAKGLTPEERDRQAKTMRYGAQDWMGIMEWARESGALNDFQLNLTGTILGYAAGGWRQVPSPRQTRHTIGIVELWEANGRHAEAAEIAAD